VELVTLLFETRMAATSAPPTDIVEMASITAQIPSPEAQSPTELVVLAHHALFLDAGFTVYLPDGDYIDPSNKLPSQFNAREKQWLVAYDHADLANKIQVIWSIWGQKILVTLEEWGDKGKVQVAVAVDSSSENKGEETTVASQKVDKQLMVCLKFFQVGFGHWFAVSSTQMMSSECDQ
jgi:hypothetical protein